LPFGSIAERRYRIGEKIEWETNRPADKGGRPDNGNLRKEVWITCPTCRRDFWLNVFVQDDRIESIDVNYSQAGWIPDDSTPVIEGGKIVAQRFVPRK